MSGPRHQTVVGRPSAVRLTAFLLLSGLLFAVPLNATANAQNATATRTAPPHPFGVYIEEAARRFGIPAAWIRAVIRAESAGDVRALSSAGAMGLMQIMPDTVGGAARPPIGSDVTPLRPARQPSVARRGRTCVRCMIATVLRAFLRPTMRDQGATKSISRAARCRPRPARMWPRCSLPSAAVTRPVRSLSPQPILAPGLARRCSSRALATCPLSIQRRRKTLRATPQWQLRLARFP